MEKTQPSIICPMNPLEFSLTFIKKMRNQPKIISKPSPRQAIAIPQLLLAKFFRKGTIKIDDMIDCAVVTSFPENQRIAKRVAEEILFLRIRTEEISLENMDISSDILSEFEEIEESDQIDAIKEILNEDNLSKMIDMDKLRNVRDFYENFLENLANDEYSSINRTMGEDPEEILRQELSSMEEVRDYVKDKLRQKIGSMNPDELKMAHQLELDDEILNESPRSREKITIKALNKEDIIKELTNIINSNINEAAKTLEYLKKCQALPQEQEQEIKDEITDKISNLEELTNVISSLGKISDLENMQEIINNTIEKFNFPQSYQLAENLDNYQPGLLKALVDSWENQVRTGGNSPPINHLAKYNMRGYSWYSMLENAVKEEISALKRNFNASDQLRNLTFNLKSLGRDCTNLVCRNEILDFINEAMDESINSTQSAPQLRKLVSLFRNHDFAPTYESITKAGKKVGMSDEEILELIEPNYEILKKAIQSGSRFDRISNIAKSINLQDYQYRELIKLAMDHNNRSALAALGHLNLSTALANAESVGGQAAMEEMVSSLTAGSGENLLVQWFNNRDYIPPSIKNQVKEMAKNLLIDIGVNYANSKIGSTEFGPIASNIVKPYTLGDDLDLIDIDETLDSILNKGKSIELIDRDDFFVSITMEGRRAVSILLDISGSMSGEKLSYMAICATMLTYALRNDELAMCFFESNTHEIKNIDEKIDIEELAEELLSLKTMGGTMIQKALQWTQKNLSNEKTDAREKLNIMFTDAALFDFQPAIFELQKLDAMGVKTVIIVPEFNYSADKVKELIKKSKGYLITVQKWRDFPSLVSEILSNRN
jgi:Mg-chelatase subunit ChlD